MKVAVVGAGWAGLAAAVTAVEGGAAVTLFEMAPQAGGRARDVAVAWPAVAPAGEHGAERVAAGGAVDNGQHICIGAYVATLGLMRTVGADPEAAFLRRPLALVGPDGNGLRLAGGPPAIAFAIAVLRHRGWGWRARLALLGAAARWQAAGFRCPPAETVAGLAAGLPAVIVSGFVEPLCVAALNTPAATASAAVFLRVVRDSLYAGRGSADLLLPRVGLGSVLPAPALAWLRERGASFRAAMRVGRIDIAAVDRGDTASTGVGGAAPSASAGPAGALAVDGEPFDAVVVATSALEAARLARPLAPAWAAAAAAFAYEPIITVYAHSEGCRLPEAMLALAADQDRPAQFVFDRGQLGGPAGLLAFVISGAAGWVARGNEAAVAATLAQGRSELAAFLAGPLVALQAIVEKRATFRCEPALRRPPMAIADAVFAAGDYVDGPYPATLEGAVRSGVAAGAAALAAAGSAAIARQPVLAG